MSIKICLQSGHDNKAGAGAPNESATNKRITDRLSTMLRLRGFEVTQTDYYAFNDPNVTKVDYRLFLALHCDMDYPNDSGSGFVDFADESLAGSGYAESQRITKIIVDNYFKETGIAYKNRSNANTKKYYMWKYLTSKTPCVLIEMGQSIDPHDSVLLGNTELIASALTRSICKAFNVSYEINDPTPSMSDLLYAKIKENDELNATIRQLKQVIKTAESDLVTKLADKDKECQGNINAYKIKISDSLLKFIKEYK